ncbi:hypothetical protein MF4642_14330 [Acinetobacter sp. MF4642]|nr:hypothetical protein MF4642_14330 [Acinetobacter sp. MF4642]
MDSDRSKRSTQCEILWGFNQKVLLFLLKLLNYINFINIVIAILFILRITDANSKHCGIAIYKGMVKQHEVYHLALAVFV